MLYVMFLLDFALALYYMNVPVFQWIASAQAQGQQIQYAPLGTSQTSESLSALFYIIPVFGLSFGLAYGIKKRLFRRFLPLLLLGVYAASAWLIYTLTFWWLTGWLPWVLVVAGFMVFAYSSLMKSSSYLRLPFLTFLGVGTAMMLTIILPSWTIVVMCLALACWDVYAVFKGPLRKIIEHEGNDLNSRLERMMLISVGGSSIGMGDVVFYSLLLMFAVQISYLAAGLAYFTIPFGVVATFFLLETKKFKALPGLPIPIFATLGMIALVIH